MRSRNAHCTQMGFAAPEWLGRYIVSVALADDHLLAAAVPCETEISHEGWQQIVWSCHSQVLLDIEGPGAPAKEEPGGPSISGQFLDDKTDSCQEETF